MTAKRTRNPSGRNKSQKGTARELVVQRLTAEPDNKQTFRPVQPREFVEFEYDELTLDNLKQACATHFGLPVNQKCSYNIFNFKFEKQWHSTVTSLFPNVRPGNVWVTQCSICPGTLYRLI